MKQMTYPKQSDWKAIIKRPVQQSKEIDARVAPIISAVRKEGDKALLRYGKIFDGADLHDISVSEEEINESAAMVSTALKQAIDTAISNINRFHKSQLITEKKIETSPGVLCWRKNVAIEKVGLYIPGGSAPLFSTVIMLAVPAHIAGCSEIILCSPPDKAGKIHPAILYTAGRLNISKIFKVGGAQAIAAMAYGTESVPRVYKIFGPGNQYVTAAKLHVSLEGIAIDMPAGPSEVVVMADSSANAAFVASDLLSQAEHGPDSQVVLVTDSETLLHQVKSEVASQLELLPRKEIANDALANSSLILVRNISEAISLVNAYAPEHLIIMTKNADQDADKILNAGSVFVGPFSPESAGDYASGTNHVLATNGFARTFSGVSVDSFLKKITFQKLTPAGLSAIGSSIEIMAQAEELYAHKQAVSIRLANRKNYGSE